MFFRTLALQVLRVAILTQFSTVLCYPTDESTFSGNYSLTVVQDVPGPRNLENIAVRHNGDMLVTSVASSSLFQVSPNKSKEPILIAEIPAALGLLGIAELEQDVFYVVASNITGLNVVPGTNRIWKVDLRQFSTTKDGTVSHPAEVSLVATILSAQLLNGLCRLAPNDTSTLLISDSSAGTVTRLNVDTGAYEIIAEDETMVNLPTGLQVSINGIHVHESNVFFINLNQGIFARFPISLSTVTPTGPVEVIVDGIPGDDFVISQNGMKAWIVLNGYYTVYEVDIPEKKQSVVLNSTLLVETTAVAFGRRRLDQNSLYISGAAIIDGGNGTTEGRVFRVDLPYNFADLYL